MKKFLLLCALVCGLAFSACDTDAGDKYITNVVAFTWKGTRSSPPASPELGWAYYNSTTCTSYYWDGSSWQIIVKDGTDGTDGVGITWKDELVSAPTNPQLNWAYYNRIEGNSYIWNGTKWDYLAKSGRDGASGIMLWLGSFDSEPENVSTGYCYYNTSDCTSYIWDGDSWEIIAKDGVDITWKGAYENAPESPKVNWAYYNTVDSKAYIWNGMQWEILSESLGGDTNVVVSITWLGTYSSAPSNPALGQAYYNNTVGASYIYDGSVWQQISKDGIDGTNGTNAITATGYLITWKGSYTSAPSNPSAGWAYYDTVAKKSYIYDGTSWLIMAQDGKDGVSGTDGNSTGSGGSDSYVYVKTETETIDGIAYTVKHYADVYTPEPYFYTYYKFYYLDGKLRRAYQFYHSFGSCLEYPYTSFSEHKCGTSTGYSYLALYDENGDLLLYVQDFDTSRQEYTFENNIKSAWYIYIQMVFCQLLMNIGQMEIRSL